MASEVNDGGQQQTWTPEPWRWSSEYQSRQGDDTWSLIGNGGYGILSCDGLANSPQANNAADADRLVACVNAMANVPDPAAFVKAVDELLRCETIYELDQKWEPLRLARGEVRK